MKTEEQIKKELETIKDIKKYLLKTKYTTTGEAVGFIQLNAQQEILEWILFDKE